MNLVIFFSGIGYSEGIFSLQVQDDSLPYQVLPRRLACVRKEPLKEELKDYRSNK